MESSAGLDQPQAGAYRIEDARYCCLDDFSSIYLMTSPTVCSFSASSSGTSTPNSSSKAITSSTMSSESAPKSSIKEACGVTCSGFTPSCSTIMSLTLSSIDFSAIKFVGFVLVARGKAYSSPGTAWQVNELKRLSIIFRLMVGPSRCDVRRRTVTRHFHADSCRLLPFAIRVDETDDISHRRDCRSS